MSYSKTKKVSHKGWPCVDIKKFKMRPLPLFLEAEVHYLKTEAGRRDSAKFYGQVKKSPLYDKNLGMYKVNASLAKEPADISVVDFVFTPGWLENESIWLHMEYKYVLELLKSGLYKEFFEEFKKTGVCFLDPAVYGRSILENSSFLASSAFPDKSNWARVFVSRLKSGLDGGIHRDVAHNDLRRKALHLHGRRKPGAVFQAGARQRVLHGQ